MSKCDKSKDFRGVVYYQDFYKIVERRVTLNGKTPFRSKILIILLIVLDGSTIRSDLVRFEHVLSFSKIEGSINTLNVLPTCLLSKTSL